ncbi:MAG: helix-turn-helix domain-containing protein [Yaniella sp.]|nr:helix-turn-helix domain-containing protein [Yaniella sp.]
MSFSATNWAMKVNRSGLLKSNEAFVLMVLANYADELWSCYPSQDRLATDTAQGRRTVVRQLKRLQELGLVISESLYGKGRGRIGNRYYLVEDALEQLLENREIERSAKLAPESQNRMNTRSAKLAHKSENREIERSANLTPEGLKCHPGHDSSANYDISFLVPIKEHARINHHHQSSDAREPSKADDQMIDDDKNELNYLGVEIQKLFQEFPELGHYVDSRSVAGLVDTVLGRATVRVANPTAYVRRALENDFYGLVLPSQDDFAPAYKPSSDIAQHLREESFEAKPAPETSSSKLPRWENLSADAEPCTNPDHWDSLHFTQFSNCPQCRIERRLGEQPRHVNSLTDQDIQRLPKYLQQWAAEARAASSHP